MSTEWDPPKIEDFDKAIEELDSDMDYMGYKIIIHLDDIKHFRKIFEIYDNIETEIAKMLLLKEEGICEVGEFKKMIVYAGDTLAPGQFMLFTRSSYT